MDCSKDECMADVHMIFKQDKKSVNLDSSEVEDGHWCALCQKQVSPATGPFLQAVFPACVHTSEGKSLTQTLSFISHSRLIQECWPL
jgi:hypothetical protein